MVNSDGSVKVLGFGLARAIQNYSSDVNVASDSPTITADYTQPGGVLGTAPYMNAEHAGHRPASAAALPGQGQQETPARHR